MKSIKPEVPQNLANCLLIASPALLDPNFRRSIVWIHSHSPKTGALGFIINRPSGVSLGEIAPETVKSMGLPADAEIFYGGPVANSETLLLHFGWDQQAGLPVVQFFHPEHPSAANQVSQLKWQAIIGHAAWAAGQLEKELQESSWIVLLPMPFFFPLAEPRSAWQEILSRMDPRLRLLASAPLDLWKN